MIVCLFNSRKNNLLKYFVKIFYLKIFVSVIYACFIIIRFGGLYGVFWKEKR